MNPIDIEHLARRMSNEDQFVITENLADALDIRDLGAQAKRLIEGFHVLVHILRLEAVNRARGLTAAALVIVVEPERRRE